MLRHLNKKAFTLLELLIIITIVIMLSFMGSEFVIQGIKMQTFTQKQDEAVYDARNILNEISKEIREAQFSSTGDYLLDTVEEQELSFYSNIDNDNLVEKIHYFLDGYNLKKGIIKPSGDPLEYLDSNETITTISSYVANQNDPIFTYFDENGNQISNPNLNKHDIRLIHIFFKIDVNPGKAPDPYNLITDVQIRNLKNNL